MRHRRFARLGLYLTALLQLSLPTFVSAADARAEAAAERGATVHVEAHETAKCVRTHSADCALCRVIGSGAAVPRADAMCAPVQVANARLPQYTRIGFRAVALCHPSQRAPPAE